MPKLSTPKTELVFRRAKPATKPYLIADGNGLSLMVLPGGGKLWIFRYRICGTARKLHLRGGYPALSLVDARKEALRLRALVAAGRDPAEERRQAPEALDAGPTFGAVALEWWKHWKTDRDADNAATTWRRVEKDLLPVLGERPIACVKPTDILAPLRAVCDRGALETAHRLLGIASRVFRYGVATGCVSSDPTRDLRDALARPVGLHYAALTTPQEVGRLWLAMREYRGGITTRAALLLGLLTFVRPGNLRCAEWAHFDLHAEHPEWRIPGALMKVRTARPFVVPLARQAVAVLEGLRPYTGRGRFLFPSALSASRPMSNNTVNTALRRMGYSREEMTGHGVRATARTLCHEVLGFSPEVIEEQLAHGKAGVLGDAYDRTQHRVGRRRLMQAWADYLDQLAGNPLLG